MNVQCNVIFTNKEIHNQSKIEMINIIYNIYLRLEKELQQRKDEMKSEHEGNENAKRFLEKENKSLIIETERINTELGKSEDERRNLEAEIKTLTDQMKRFISELQDVNDAKEKLETEYKR